MTGHFSARAFQSQPSKWPLHFMKWSFVKIHSVMQESNHYMDSVSASLYSSDKDHEDMLCNLIWTLHRSDASNTRKRIIYYGQCPCSPVYSNNSTSSSNWISSYNLIMWGKMYSSGGCQDLQDYRLWLEVSTASLQITENHRRHPSPCILRKLLKMNNKFLEEEESITFQYQNLCQGWIEEALHQHQVLRTMRNVWDCAAEEIVTMLQVCILLYSGTKLFCGSLCFLDPELVDGDRSPNSKDMGCRNSNDNYTLLEDIHHLMRGQVI